MWRALIMEVVKNSDSLWMIILVYIFHKKIYTPEHWKANEKLEMGQGKVGRMDLVKLAC
jgi:hypothetical protein